MKFKSIYTPGLIFLVLCPLLSWSIDAKKARKWDLDSLYYRAFNEIGNHIRKGQIEGEKFYQAALLLQDSNQLAYALDLKGWDCHIRDKIDSAKYFANRSIELFRITKDSSGLSTAIYNLSNYHEYLGEYSSALRLLHLAREIDINIGEKDYNDVFYYNRLSEIFYSQDQLDLSLRYLHKAWNAHVESNYWHNYFTPILHQNYAWLYVDMGINELAEYHAKRTYSLTKPDSLLTIRTNALDVLSIVAQNRGDRDAALNYAKKSLELCKQYGDPYYIIYSHLFLMELYADMEDMQTAQAYADSVHQSMEPYNINPSFRADMNEELYKHYKKKGNEALALKHLEISSEAQNSINKIDGLAAMKQFDEEMANRYRELMKAKSQLQEEELNLRNTLLLSTLLVLGGVCVFLIFLFLSNKKIRVINAKLREKNLEIHKQKQALQAQQEELEERNLDLEKLNASKDRLFSILTHDLRQPFNQILGVIDVVEHNELEAKDRGDLMKALKESVQDTADLVSNVLTWSKAQFAGVTVKPENLPLANAVKKALLHFSIALDKKHIKVVFDIPEDLSVVFDKDHFESVLRNIFSNAYKFSAKNSKVYLKAWADEKAKRVYLGIRDEGMGMDQHQRELLISGEEAVDSLSGTLNEQGTGIGMVIVRDFLKENNSSFDIESQLNEGTNFILNMPLGKKVNYKPSSNLKSVHDFL